MKYINKKTDKGIIIWEDDPSVLVPDIYVKCAVYGEDTLEDIKCSNCGSIKTVKKKTIIEQKFHRLSTLTFLD